MNYEKANEVAKIVREIEKCKSFLNSLKDRSYEDEFEIHYRGGLTCELETEALHILIEYYEKKLKIAEEKLKTV